MNKLVKRQRFEKVASNRVQKIINYLFLLQNCANRNNYEYSEEDINYMFTEIQKALRDTKSKFSSELSKANKSEFQFNK